MKLLVSLSGLKRILKQFEHIKLAVIDSDKCVIPRIFN